MNNAERPISELPIMDVDLLVIGAGMAGLTAGAFAASKGLNVGIVEKAPEIGGSALLAAGGLLKPKSVEALKAANPGGNPAFADILYSRHDALIEWISSLGVSVTPPADGEEAVGVPAIMRGIDIARYIALCRLEVESSGGWIVTSTQVDSLDMEDGNVRGAIVHDRDGTIRVQAGHTLLATGGFQGSEELRRRYMGEQAANMLLRANPFSVGDGLQLGLAAGGATTREMDYFYGHTIPFPLDHEFRPSDYSRLAMPFMLPRSLLFDKDGQRFVDESSTYCYDARAVLFQPESRALLVGDQTLLEADAAGFVVNRTLGVELVDRLADARRAGAHACEAESLEELDRLVAEWGYKNIAKGIHNFNTSIAKGENVKPSRKKYARLYEAPYFAIEVQPAITFTFGGLEVDDKAQVLRQDGTVIPGLLAAGADVGGVFCEQYCSGLNMAATFAMQAVETVLAKSGKPTMAV